MNLARLITLLILAASLVTQAQAFGPQPAKPTATPTATAKAPPPATKPAKRTPTPAPDLISVPIAEIEGPTKVAGTFMLIVKSDPAASNTWRNVLPEAASPPIELELKDGRTMLWFQEPPAGVYLFRLRSQLPAAGLDPIIDVEHTVNVGTLPRPPPIDPIDPVDPVDPVDPTTKATAATYVYEKDSHVVPPEVKAALGRLNSETTILGSMYEQDVTDGDGDVPEQYKVPVKAAREIGLPALVVTSGGTVLKVIPKPTTADDVLKAVQ